MVAQEEDAALVTVQTLDAPEILRIAVSRPDRMWTSFRSRACSRSNVDRQDRGCDDASCTMLSLLADLAVPLFTQVPV